MRNILVVEDHPLVAEATKSLLSTMALDQVTLCENAEEAVARLRERTNWFRLFLDIGVPGASGLSLIHHVHQQGFSSRSAVITASENQEWRAEIKSLGFLGYVVKTASAHDFSFALQEILEGRFHFMQKQSEEQAIHLTRKQTDILRLMRDGLSTPEMAFQLQLSSATVTNHIRAILHALRAEDRAQAVSKGVQQGYIEAMQSE